MMNHNFSRSLVCVLLGSVAGCLAATGTRSRGQQHDDGSSASLEQISISTHAGWELTIRSDGSGVYGFGPSAPFVAFVKGETSYPKILQELQLPKPPLDIGTQPVGDYAVFTKDTVELSSVAIYNKGTIDAVFNYVHNIRSSNEIDRALANNSWTQKK